MIIYIYIYIFFFFLDSLFQKLTGCLASFFLSLNFHHSSLNFSHTFGIITQFPSLNIFHTIYRPIRVSQCSFFFFFFFSIPKLTEDKQKKKKKRTEQPTQEKEKIKSKVVKSCSQYCLRVPHVCLITKMPLSYELWKLKIAKNCFQFP